MNMQQAIAAVTDRQDLSQAQMQAVMNLIMTGEATQAQVGGFLVGLRMKGETVDEITGAVMVAMRALSNAGVQRPKVTMSSTPAALVVTALAYLTSRQAVPLLQRQQGAQVAKHGNRSISSKEWQLRPYLKRPVSTSCLKPSQVELCIASTRCGLYVCSGAP